MRRVQFREIDHVPLRSQAFRAFGGCTQSPGDLLHGFRPGRRSIPVTWVTVYSDTCVAPCRAMRGEDVASWSAILTATGCASSGRPGRIAPGCARGRRLDEAASLIARSAAKKVPDPAPNGAALVQKSSGGFAPGALLALSRVVSPARRTSIGRLSSLAKLSVVPPEALLDRQVRIERLRNGGPERIQDAGILSLPGRALELPIETVRAAP